MKCDRTYPHGPHADARPGLLGLLPILHHFHCPGIPADLMKAARVRRRRLLRLLRDKT